MAKETEKAIYVLDNDESGVVTISESVIAVIAAYAVTDVQGVASMAGGITAELLAKVGIATLSKGIRISIEGEEVVVDAAISVEYGASIPTVSSAIQEKIKTSVNNMTGLNVKNVNVHITNVEIEN